MHVYTYICYSVATEDTRRRLSCGLDCEEVSKNVRIKAQFVFRLQLTRFLMVYRLTICTRMSPWHASSDTVVDTPISPPMKSGSIARDITRCLKRDWGSVTTWHPPSTNTAISICYWQDTWRLKCSLKQVCDTIWHGVDIYVGGTWTIKLICLKMLLLSTHE